MRSISLSVMPRRCRLAEACGCSAADAAHLAITAAHGIDYLLTWDYAHMADPLVQARFDSLCAAEGVTAPLLVSPESIPQARFGQSIRRKG
jgi:hypothetical protein